ncbi:MAG: Nramp family divalent metal transporter [Patescibacteria group bacterium]|nr:Nramp family divalent metal transporter [Patescibacteria group bacterium]
MTKTQEKTFARKKSSHHLGFRLKRLGKFWHGLGPGLTTGAADDDPSGIATYSQTGSRYGFQMLWLAVFTFPFMAVIQEMCARIGLVTGRGLASNIRLHFPRWMLYVCAALLFVANTFNIGADLGAMAKATELLAPQLKYALLLIGFTAVILILEIFTSYRQYSKILKVLALALLAYVITALTLKGIDWGDIARHAVSPSLKLTRDQILLVCGILGTTISPYLFFWQTSQEVEEEILDGQTTIKARSQENNWPEIKNMRRDVWIGMFFSNLVMFFIILTAGAVLHPAGITDIQTAAQAAEALSPLAGKYASLLFTLGVVGVGLLAIPVLAGSAAYVLSESFRWREGLYRKLKNAYAFYGVIIASIIIGLILNFTGLDPIKALIYAAIINGLIAPILMVFILLVSNNKKHMGEYVNKPGVNFFGWIITIFMILVALASIYVILN